jgi:hypothetical protein
MNAEPRISLWGRAACSSAAITDLADRGYGRSGHDFLADHNTRVDHVVTNPPYGPVLSTRFIAHALTRIRPNGTVCMLLPVAWGTRQTRRHLMAKCCRKWEFSRRLQMHRGDYSGKKASPQLDVAWYVFANEHAGPTATVPGVRRGATVDASR